MASTRERSNEDWLRDLRDVGQPNRDACAALRALLVGRLGRALGPRGVDADSIEDFAQEAVVRVLGGLGGFRGDSRFTTWATAVALRSAFSELRRARWKDVSLDEQGVDRWPADPAPTAEDDVQRRSLAGALQRGIERELTPRQRIAVLAKLDGVPQVTLAERLGTNTNALYKLQHDARRRLRQAVLDAGFSEDDVRQILDRWSEEP